MKKILLVEDNAEISKNISEYLELHDYSIDLASDGEIGIEKATRGSYDLILLDLMLPEVDGLTIARRVSEKNPTPIIMTTARGSIEDKLKGFEKGAIDYLVKPFDLRELLARVQVALQKESSLETESSVFTTSDVEIDLKKRVFLKGGKDINVTQKEYMILEYLLGHSPNAVSRTDLIDAVWGESERFEADGKLDVYIHTIRSKFGKTFISTIKGFGYKVSE
ncbi:response regulator transcription factor [Candidatus Gracilibacteria bacterium]|nr:response regulator transcription factor [Candidatus Gracilibacteria bacterium]